MADLVKRLRAVHWNAQHALIGEAADAIEELTAALRDFTVQPPLDPITGRPLTFKQFVRTSASALLSKYGADNG